MNDSPPADGERFPVFETLYHRQHALDRHISAPYAKEREQYLAFLASQGMRPETLMKIAAGLYWVARLIPIVPDINTVRDWLGHVSIDTTNVYAQIDLDMQTKALKHCEIFDKSSRKCWKGKHGVLRFLRSL